MKISQQKREKIAEQILAFLFAKSPQAIYTAHIAQEIARDEEFVKTLLIDLKKKALITEVNKNAKGTPYVRRQRWKLTSSTYNLYNQLQK